MVFPLALTEAAGGCAGLSLSLAPSAQYVFFKKVSFALLICAGAKGRIHLITIAL
jgi:hypothetical protein